MSEQLETRMVSAAVTRTASDGSKFDTLYFVPEQRAKLRGETLVQMRKLAETKEPALLKYFESDQGISAEYAMSSGISHANDKGLKGDLVKLSISESLAEGDRWGVIRMLEYANAHELDLPEFDDAYIAGLYEAEMQEGDHDEAWQIAFAMADPITRGKALKYPNEEAVAEADRVWGEREATSFELHAKDVLAQDELLPADAWNAELRMLFDTFRFKEDVGYQAEQPSELAQITAQRMVSREVAAGRDYFALVCAVDGRLPEDQIKALRLKVSPQGKAVARLTKWFEGVKIRVSALTAKK